MYNGSAQSVGKHGVRLSTSRQLYFDIVLKIWLIRQSAREGGLSLSELKKFLKECCRPPVMGTRQFLELLGSAGRRERAGIFSHNQSVASQIFL